VQQPAAALWGLRALVSVFPIAASAVTYWAVTRYPLHGEGLAEVKRRLAERRTTGDE
jgi:Na+/melibiose symporter-like transporter